MKIKVCGMHQIEQIEQLDKLGIDFYGLIFYPPSPRFVLNAGNVEGLKSLRLHAKKIGVFVNEPLSQIEKIIDTFQLDGVQLHGEESIDYCQTLFEQTTVIKVFSVSQELPRSINLYAHAAHYYLFDTHSAQKGGTGLQFDWSVLYNAPIQRPFFLSGGIGLNDMESIRKINHPHFAAVDINSRFEIRAGIKDISKIESFLADCRRP